MTARRILLALWLALPPLVVAALSAAALLAPGAAVEWVERLSPGCIFHRLTGISCPGCGGTRALQSLLQGDWKQALSYNLFLWPTLGLLAFEYARSWWLLLHGRPQGIATHPLYTRLLQAYAIGLCAWFVLRNIFSI